MKKTWIYLIVLLVIAIGIVAYFNISSTFREIDQKIDFMLNEEKKSGEQYYQVDVESYRKNIDLYAGKIDEISGEKKVREYSPITSEEYGEEVHEFQEALGQDLVIAEIETYEDKYVGIIPASDFLDIEKYYYASGKLVLYSREFMGVGGFSNYYFVDENLVDIQTELEPEIDFEPEDKDKILERAAYNYETYLSK